MAKQPAKRATAAEPESDDEAADLPEAKVVGPETAEDPLRLVKLGGFAFALLVGWTFVILANHHHITAPVVFVCLAYLAILLTVVNLWRTGVAAADARTVDDWQRPIGARGALIKEKKTLLKAIKEAEFDFAMGKLSKADSDALIKDYRARAIAVIKELDRDSDSQLSAREQIEAEVKARIALDAQNKPSKRAKNEAAKQAAKRAPKPADKPEDKVEEESEDNADKAEAPAEPPAEVLAQAAEQPKSTATGESS